MLSKLETNISARYFYAVFCDRQPTLLRCIQVAYVRFLAKK